MLRRTVRQASVLDAAEQRRQDTSQVSLLKPSLTRAAKCSTAKPCNVCKSDQNFLRQRRPPDEPTDRTPIAVVELFAGCGAMSVGFREAARRAGRGVQVALAVDSDPRVLEIYKRNVPALKIQDRDVTQLFDGAIGGALTESERSLVEKLGPVDVVLGGPPCQGHSDLNNRTRRDDPKNGLYLRMARAAEVLGAKVVVVENVATVRWDKSSIVQVTTHALRDAGFSVDSLVLDLLRVGVPQRRHRHLLLASAVKGLDPLTLLNDIAMSMFGHRNRTVGWAIRDLLKTKPETAFDTPSQRSNENQKRIAFLFDEHLYDLPNSQRPECHREGGHSYTSVYGRLRWNLPAQTVTTGFGSMGQGRYVHPERRRTITPHEAARLQTFPDWFDFGNAQRGVMARAIGNAVPPLLMVALGQRMIPLLRGATTQLRLAK